MTDEEKKAIDYLNADVEYLQEELKNPNYIGRFITIQDKEFKYLKTILNLIEKQNKIINEMAKYIAETDVTEQMCPKCKYRNVECTLEQCIERVIEYFTKKVGE